MRRLIAFPCAGDTLVATLDEAPGATGLLIVSGGNEIRMGAHRGMAMLAARVASAGAPVFRFDRRGVGDSTGQNRGFEQSVQDIAGAAATFLAECPQLRRIVAFGNCDAATALALFHQAAAIDALILANPWTIDAPDELPPRAAIGAHYAQRLRDPRQWLRLARGGVDIGKLFSGLKKISQGEAEVEAPLAARMADAIRASQVPVTMLLANTDNTAVAFTHAWKPPEFQSAWARCRAHVCETSSHSFAREADREWLFQRVVEALH